MRKAVNVLVALSAMAMGTSTYADTIEVEYKRFYSHVKKLNGEDTQGLQFAFGFMHVTDKRLCTINSASIVTQKKTIPLDVSTENRFTIHAEKALNLADAKVAVDLAQPSNQCDMSVQLETKPEWLKENYTKEDLAFIYEQYAAFFNEMGSFLSFMMPSVSGLMFHFEDINYDAYLEDAPAINKGTMILNQEWLDKNKGLTLPRKPLRITALTSK